MFQRLAFTSSVYMKTGSAKTTIYFMRRLLNGFLFSGSNCRNMAGR